MNLLSNVSRSYLFWGTVAVGAAVAYSNQDKVSKVVLATLDKIDTYLPPQEQAPAPVPAAAPQKSIAERKAERALRAQEREQKLDETPNAQDPSTGMTRVMQIILRKEDTHATLEHLQRLIDNGANLHLTDKNKMTVLHHAALHNKPKVLAFLVKKDVDPSVKDKDNYLFTEYADLVGISPDIYNKKKKTSVPADIYRGTSSTSYADRIQTIIHSVMRMKDNDATKAHIQKLIDRGANVNDVDGKKRTALHFAAMLGQKNLYAFLLSKGADPDARDIAGNTAATYARFLKSS